MSGPKDIYKLHFAQFINQLKYTHKFCKHTPDLFTDFVSQKIDGKLEKFTEEDKKEFLKKIKNASQGKISVSTNTKIDDFIRTFNEEYSAGKYIEQKLPEILTSHSPAGQNSAIYAD